METVSENCKINVWDNAQEYVAAGHSVGPVYPSGARATNYKQYYTRRATPDQMKKWFVGGEDEALNIEVHGEYSHTWALDFDDHDGSGRHGEKEVLALKASLRHLGGAWWDKYITVYATKNGTGRRIVWRCKSNPVPEEYRNTDGHGIAWEMLGDSPKAVIELKSRFVVPGGADQRYRYLSGPTIPDQTNYIAGHEQQLIVALAAKLGTCTAPVKEVRPEYAPPVETGDHDKKPGEYFNEMFAADLDRSWIALMERAGYFSCGYGPAHGEHRWQRPGGTQMSVTTGYDGRNVLTVFSENCGLLENGKSYSPFGVYAHLLHNSDFKAAARAICSNGGRLVPPFRQHDPDAANFTVLEDVTAEAPDPTLKATPKAPTADPTIDWPVPRSLQPSQLPPFPVDALDVAPAFRQMVEAVAHYIQVPSDLPATIGLSVLGVGTAKNVTVEVRPGVDEQAVVWTLCGLPPGERKTPCVNRMKRPLKTWEEADTTNRQKLVNSGRAERKIKKNRLAEIEKSIKTTTDGSPEYQQCLDEYGAIEFLLAQPEPEMPRLLIDDATPEAVINFLQKQKYKAAVITDESTFLEVTLGRYSDNPNMELYLKAWSGDGMPIDRKGTGVVLLPEAYLTLGLCIQPGPLKDLAEHGRANDKGFLQRFLTALPRSLMGERDQIMDRFPDAVQDAWDALVLRLLDGKPRRLTHSAEGWDYLRDIEKKYEPALKENGYLRAISGWVGKAFPGQLLRVAAVLHVASGDETDIIPVDALKAATRIVEHYLEHALHIHDVLRGDAGLDVAQKILATIATKKMTDFKASHFKTQIWALRQGKAGEEILTAAYERLMESGIIRPSATAKDKNGDERITRFVVHPKLCEG